VKARHLAQVLGGIVVGFFFLWLLFRKIDLADVGAAFAQAHVAWIVAAVICFGCGYAFRIERWRLMLLADNAGLRWAQCAGPFMASVATNNVLPLRAGDILRASAFNRRLGVTGATSVTTLVVERLLDLLMLLCFLGVTLGIFGLESSRLVGFGSGVLIAAGLVILLTLILPSLFSPLALGLAALVGRLIPRLGEALTGIVRQIFLALDHSSGAPVMARLLACSAAAWLLEGLVFWCSALALPSLVEPLAAWLALPVGTLATIVPSTPGFAGSFDFFTAKAMQLLGNPAATATAFAVLVHGVLWLPPTLAGGLYLLLHPIKRTTTMGSPNR